MKVKNNDLAKSLGKVLARRINRKEVGGTVGGISMQKSSSQGRNGKRTTQIE
jgi:hypothetical protein